MIVIGLLLILIVAVVAVVLITTGNGAVTFNLIGVDIDTTARNLYLTGAVSLLIAVVGLWLVRKGLHRQRVLRKENRTLRREAKANRDAPPAQSENHETAGDHFDSAPKEEPPRHP